GFFKVTHKLLQLDIAAARNFYAEHSQRDLFHSLMKFMTSGLVLAMILEKEDVVAQWCALIGCVDVRIANISHPQSIRALCGGAVLAMILEKEDVFAKSRALTGPTDARTKNISHPERIRALCG
ncbi:hypothetical protein KI387_002192, partial [Taxus chinensis]